MLRTGRTRGEVDKAQAIYNKLINVVLDVSFDINYDVIDPLVWGIVLGTWPAMDMAQDVAAIRRMRRALSEANAAYDGLTASARVLLQTRLFSDSRDPRDPLLIVRDSGRWGVGLDLLCIIENNRDLWGEMDRLMRLVEDEIPRRHEARTALGRINIDAVIVVDGCRQIWKNLTGKDAPAKRLNPATPFGAFLEEMMQAAAVNANIESAFRAWANEQARVDT